MGPRRVARKIFFAKMKPSTRLGSFNGAAPRGAENRPWFELAVQDADLLQWGRAAGRGKSSYNVTLESVGR